MAEERHYMSRKEEASFRAQAKEKQKRANKKSRDQIIPWAMFAAESSAGKAHDFDPGGSALKRLDAIRKGSVRAEYDPKTETLVTEGGSGKVFSSGWGPGKMRGHGV